MLQTLTFIPVVSQYLLHPTSYHNSNNLRKARLLYGGSEFKSITKLAWPYVYRKRENGGESTGSSSSKNQVILKLLQNDPDTGRNFLQPPLISFKRDKNIGNFLVRSAFETSDQPGTFKCARALCKTCPFSRNVEKMSGPKRFIKITDHFTCISANVIYSLFGKTSAKQGDD